MKSLNDIAAKYGKRVDNWTRLKAAREIIEKHPDGLKAIEGRNGGTYATDEIAKEFERWCQKIPQKDSSRIYFIRAVNTRSFKVGVASDPRKRLRELRIGSPVKLVLSRDVECDNAFEVEQRIHGCLKEFHSHGEWFNCPIDKALQIFDSQVKR